MMGGLALDILVIIGYLLCFGAVLGVLCLLAEFLPVIYYLGSAIAGGIFGVVEASEGSSCVGEFFGGAFIALLVALIFHGWIKTEVEKETKGTRRSSDNAVSRNEMQAYVRNQNAENIWFTAGFYGKLNQKNQENIQDAYWKGYDDGYYDN